MHFIFKMFQLRQRDFLLLLSEDYLYKGQICWVQLISILWPKPIPQHVLEACSINKSLMKLGVKGDRVIVKEVCHNLQFIIHVFTFLWYHSIAVNIVFHTLWTDLWCMEFFLTMFDMVLIFQMPKEKKNGSRRRLYCDSSNLRICFFG